MASKATKKNIKERENEWARERIAIPDDEDDDGDAFDERIARIDRVQARKREQVNRGKFFGI
jgi:hypothetical protein